MHYQIKRDTTDIHVHGHNDIATCLLKFIVEVHSQMGMTHGYTLIWGIRLHQLLYLC